MSKKRTKHDKKAEVMLHNAVYESMTPEERTGREFTDKVRNTQHFAASMATKLANDPDVRR